MIIKISILQFKSFFANMTKNFQIVEKLFENAIKESPDIIVLPELWSTGFYPKPIENFADKNGRETSKMLATLAKKYDVNIVGGTVIVEENNQFYNRCFVFNREGKNIAIYDKNHLFSMSKENEVFTAGSEIPIFEIDSIKSSVIVCYDIRFPELIRQVALCDISMLFVPAAWPIKRLSHWQILSRARAIENQIFVIAANSAGHSAIINPWGDVLVESKLNDKILTTTINLDICKEIRDTMNVFADRCDSKIKI